MTMCIVGADPCVRPGIGTAGRRGTVSCAVVDARSGCSGLRRMADGREPDGTRRNSGQERWAPEREVAGPIRGFPLVCVVRPPQRPETLLYSKGIKKS